MDHDPQFGGELPLLARTRSQVDVFLVQRHTQGSRRCDFDRGCGGVNAGHRNLHLIVCFTQRLETLCIDPNLARHGARGGLLGTVVLESLKIMPDGLQLSCLLEMLDVRTGLFSVSPRLLRGVEIVTERCSHRLQLFNPRRLRRDPRLRRLQLMTAVRNAGRQRLAPLQRFGRGISQLLRRFDLPLLVDDMSPQFADLAPVRLMSLLFMRQFWHERFEAPDLGNTELVPVVISRHFGERYFRFGDGNAGSLQPICQVSKPRLTGFQGEVMFVLDLHAFEQIRIVVLRRFAAGGLVQCTG